MLAPTARNEIFVVDADPAMRNSLAEIVSSARYNVVCFADESSFLAAVRLNVPACVVLDMHLPGGSAMRLLNALTSRSYPAPILLMSDFADIPMAVKAIKSGARDFIQKPFEPARVMNQIRDAIGSLPDQFEAGIHLSGCAPLSQREQQVITHLMAGASNKDIALRLGISPRTVEVHRSRLLKKVGARNATDLVRIIMTEAHQRSASIMIALAGSISMRMLTGFMPHI